MALPLIKFLLIGAVVTVGLLAFRGSRRAIHKVLWRGYVVLVVIAAGLSILFPDSLTDIAQRVGVRRGADLLLYVLVVTFMLVSVVLFRRLGDLERRYVELARAHAIREVLPGERPAGDRADHATGDGTADEAGRR